VLRLRRNEAGGGRERRKRKSAQRCRQQLSAIRSHLSRLPMMMCPCILSSSEFLVAPQSGGTKSARRCLAPHLPAFPSPAGGMLVVLFQTDVYAMRDSYPIRNTAQVAKYKGLGRVLAVAGSSK